MECQAAIKDQLLKLDVIGRATNYHPLVESSKPHIAYLRGEAQVSQGTLFTQHVHEANH